jgi:Ca2+/Na+ antiporter
MLDFSALFGQGQVLLLVGALLLFASSRACADALAGAESRPGRRALGHWFPIAAAAIVAIALGRGNLALSIIFATSVGCLSLLLGAMSIVTPDAPAPAEYRRFWPFALPAALLAVLIGFAGQLSWRHALILLIEGGGLLFVWQEICDHESAAVGDENLAELTGPAAIRSPVRALNFVLAVIVCGIGAVAAILGSRHLISDAAALPETATMVGVIAPILVLPMLSSGARLAQSNRAWAAVTAGIGVVVLNLCLLLPIVVLLWYLRQCVIRTSTGALSFELSTLKTAGPLPFGWVTWRVDAVVLLLLTFVLFPASLGRWKLGRAEGFTLVLLYVVYVLLEAAGSLRS